MELLKMMSWKWITQKGLVFIKGGMRESSFSLFHITAQWRWIQTLPPRSGCHLVIALGLPILQTVLSRARDLRKGPADARQVFYYWHFVILFVFICLGQSACPPHLTCGGGGGQRTILRSQFSPSTRSILELELRLPGLVASTLTYRVTLPNLDFFYCESGSHYIGQIGTGVMILLLSLPGSWDYRPAAQTWLLFSRVMGI